MQREQLEGAAHREVLELRQHPDGRYSSTRPQRVELPSARISRSPGTFEVAHPPGRTLLLLPGASAAPPAGQHGARGRRVDCRRRTAPLGYRVRGSDRIMRSTRDVRRANSAVRRRAWAQTQYGRFDAASAERRRWPCWRRCGWSAGVGVADGEGGLDEGGVGEGLGVVAEVALAGGVDFLG